MAQCRIVRESYVEAVGDVRPLFREHFEELATYQDVPLDPDFDLYRAGDDAGTLRIYTARTVDGGLVGYAIYWVRGHPHYRSTLWAVSDIILVRKEYRNAGLGNSLFDFVEKSLADEGVEVIYTMAKLAHPELSFLLEARGHARNEIIHAKRL